MNSLMISSFIDICKMKQLELKKYICEYLKLANYDDIINEDGFLYATGDIPVLLMAHMDTVHASLPNDIKVETTKNGETIISSLQGIGGDDRCGIFMILELIKSYKCSVLFLEDEEIGCVGARKFCKFINPCELKSLSYMIEFDRMGSEDAVFYDCDNEEFTEYIVNSLGFKEAIGSFSDISTIAPFTGIAAVNISCGYYNAHCLTEYVVVQEMVRIIDVVSKLLERERDEKSVQFEYIERAYSFDGYDSFNYYGDDYFNTMLTVYYNEPRSSKLKECICYGETIEVAWNEFFFTNPNVCYNDVLDSEVDNF